MMNLVIKNAKLVTPDGVHEGVGLGIRDGKIAMIAPDDVLPPAEREYDAKGRYVVPGLIDGHVHFRDPGMTHKENFSTGSLAAAYGGVTTILDMPNTVPPTIHRESIEEKEEVAAGKSWVDYGFIGLIVQHNANQDSVQDMLNAGVVGFKCFLGQTEQGPGCPMPPDDGALLEAMEAIAKTGLRIAFHAENNAIMLHRMEHLKKMGRHDLRAHLEVRPPVTEVEAIQRVGLFAQYTGCKVHICHLSSAEGIEEVRNWQRRGADITTETGAQYCFLDGSQIEEIGPIMRVNPPVRDAKHGAALLDALVKSHIQMIASDHAPHAREEKQGDSLWNTKAGMIGVETAARLFLSEGVVKGKMSMQQFVRLTSYWPSLVWNIYPQKGAIRIGSDADLTVIDLDQEWTIRNEDLHSLHPMTAFDGRTGRGMPVTTIVRGQIVVDEGRHIGTPIGMRVRPTEQRYTLGGDILYGYQH